MTEPADEQDTRTDAGAGNPALVSDDSQVSEPAEEQSAGNPADDEPDTFPREYVENLRRENARYRERAGRADDLAERLHTALVRETGRLADPDDLPFDETHLDDPDTLTAAIDELLDRKPHLAARRVSGDVGQGQTGSQNVDLAGMLRARA